MSYTLPNPPLAIDAGDNDEPEYPAAAFRAALGAVLATTKGDQSIARTGALDTRAFKVTRSGQNVLAAAGGYSIGTSAGPYLCATDEQATVDTLDPADATNPRIDLVVLRVDDPDNGGQSNRQASLELIKGTPAANPAIPTVSGTDVHANLARIDIPRQGQGQPAITDLRHFTAAAGGIVPVQKESELTDIGNEVGLHAYVIDTGQTYVRTKNGWQSIALGKDLTQAEARLSGKLQAGRLSFSPKADEISTQRVKFSPAFSKTPNVIISPEGTAAGTLKMVATTKIDKTGFDAVIFRSNASNTWMQWIALEP